MRFSEILLSNCNATFACGWATFLILMEQHEAYHHWEQQQSPVCRSRIREMCVWEFSIPVTMFYTLCFRHYTELLFAIVFTQEKRQRTSAPLGRRNRTKVRARVFRTNHQKVLNEDRKIPLIIVVLCSSEQGSCYAANFIYTLSGFSSSRSLALTLHLQSCEYERGFYLFVGN